MNKEQVEKEFQKFYTEMCRIDSRMVTCRDQLLIAYQAGVIISGQHFIDVMNKKI